MRSFDGCGFGFCCSWTGISTTSFFSTPVPVTRARRRARIASTRRGLILNSFSEPFPRPDVFASPDIVFSTPSWALLDYRPELVGSVLWMIALYLGVFGPRWGSVVHDWLRIRISEEIADVFHSAPFVFSGFAVDGVIRACNGGNAVGAIAGGLSLAFYAGVGELGRLNEQRRAIADEQEKAAYDVFVEFAGKSLKKTGRCHLVDVRKAMLAEPKARFLGRRNDAFLRKCIRRWAKNSRVSPNGFYRGLSVRTKD